MIFYAVCATIFLIFMILLGAVSVYSFDHWEKEIATIALAAAVLCGFGSAYFWFMVSDEIETSEIPEIAETTVEEPSKWTAEQIEYITRCVYFEVGTESDACQKAVASVILNQLNAGYWGSDPIAIVTNSNMYSTAYRTLYDPLIPDERCRKNVLEILQNGSCLDPRIRYFRADHHFEWSEYVGDFNIGVVYFGHFENENYH